MSHVSDKQREDMVAYCDYLVSKAPLIHYAEIRPIPYVHLPTWAAAHSLLSQGGHFTTDCSGMVTCVCKWAGLSDPNGCNYDGEGYTGTLLNHLPHYRETSHAHPGAIGVYGVNPGVHAIMLMERDGDNPWVFSHGQEAGPFRIRLSDESAAHEGQPLTWLDISRL